MKSIPVVIKRKGKRNTRTLAVSNPKAFLSVSYTNDRPNVKQVRRKASITF